MKMEFSHNSPSSDPSSQSKIPSQIFIGLSFLLLSSQKNFGWMYIVYDKMVIRVRIMAETAYNLRILQNPT